MKKFIALVVVSLSLLAAETQACTARVVGSYLVDVLEQGSGDRVSRGVLSLTGSRTLTVIDSNQGGIPDVFAPFTAALGSWACDGQTAFVGRAIDFSIPHDGSSAGIARVDYAASVNNKGEISGTVELRFFALSDDPQANVPATSTFDISGVAVKAQ
jgi:hypothetical protein